MQIEGKGKVARSFAVGKLIATKAKEKGIAKVVFDRAVYQYHGRVKAVADGARKGGSSSNGRAKRPAAAPNIPAADAPPAAPAAPAPTAAVEEHRPPRGPRARRRR